MRTTIENTTKSYDRTIGLTRLVTIIGPTQGITNAKKSLLHLNY